MNACKKSCAMVLLATLCLAAQNGCPGTQPTDQQSSVLVDKSVNVPGGGGFADIAFNASNGQVILITLTAANTDLEPYGSLLYPDDTGDYQPPLTTAANGVNSAQLTLNQTGSYMLTVYDGSNMGGSVAVRIELVP